MKKIIGLLLLVMILAEFDQADAQVIIGVRPRRGGNGRMFRQRQKQTDAGLPKFEPSVNIAVGYGFPNVDKNELPVFYNYYQGTFSQNGPVTGSADYQFSRNMSIGVLVTHGKVSVPYYDNSSAPPALTGSLDNWSFMLNVLRYMPVYSKKVSPYIRTAIGVNSWQQNFTDAGGSKVNIPFTPDDLAYQVGLGAKFNLSKNAGFFVEAGYGKYILHGGLAFKF